MLNVKLKKYSGIVFLYSFLLFAFTTIASGQDTSTINWKEYINSELHFSIKLPAECNVKLTDNKIIAFTLPKLQKSNSLDRHEIEIALYKSDSCCTNAGFAYQNFWNPEPNEDTIKKISIYGKQFYIEYLSDLAMGGRVCFHTFYSTCDEKNKFCFVLYSQIFCQYPYNEKTESYGVFDFDKNVELNTVLKMLNTLRFTD